MQKKILIVDDDSLVRLGLEKFVSKIGHTAVTASSGKKALDLIEAEEPDIVLLDLKLPDSLDGLEILEIIKNTRPEITVIMISGQTEIHGAVQAMKLGAFDYLEKPVDFNRLHEIVSQVAAEESHAEAKSCMDDAIFASEKMKKIVAIMKRLASKSDMTILVLGESGTGKNFLCQKMHYMSPRKEYPYVQVGCANMPEHLIESELFGYEKGAFTDAKASKKGLIEMAQGGTILFDEIGEMPYQFQAKLLSVLEDKCFRKVGALQPTPADVRILAATNRDLHKEVQEKKFRLDLYYRLNVATIELPPLRERREDIPLLVNAFLERFSRQYDCERKVIAPKGIELLQDYSWPGNVRQLKNLIEKLVVLSEGDRIDEDEISSNLLVQQQKVENPAENNFEAELSSGLSLAAMEERYIRSALKLAGGNQRKAAELLCISRDTLRYRLKKLGIN